LAYTTGTATDYLDLLSKLNTYLVAQGWTQKATSSSSYALGSDTVDAEYYWMAPGLSGTEQIYINARAYHNTAGNYYNWEMRGAQGYLGSNPFDSQPGTSGATYLYLQNSSIPYTFIVNGQRVIVIAQVSTVYETAYLGKILPYGTPGQYPYPVFIGGSGYDQSRRFSDTSGVHHGFFDASMAYLCQPGGAWTLAANYNSGGNGATSGGGIMVNIGPWYIQGSNSTRLNYLTQNLDGSYSVMPGMLVESSPAQLLGEFDGVGFVTGYSNGATNTITIGGTSWFVVPDTFRSSADNYAAIALA
jgi:hypothetical protein